MSMLLHEHDEHAIVCLLDIAKASPSIPHPCLLEGLQIPGAPLHIYDLVASIYSHGTESFRDMKFPLWRGMFVLPFPLCACLGRLP